MWKEEASDRTRYSHPLLSSALPSPVSLPCTLNREHGGTVFIYSTRCAIKTSVPNRWETIERALGIDPNERMSC